jgi:Putative porin
MSFNYSFFVQRPAAIATAGALGLMMIAGLANAQSLPSPGGDDLLSTTSNQSNPLAVNSSANPDSASLSTQARARQTMPASSVATPEPTPSQNVVINLINRLVQRGVLTRQDANELIRQAENDAATARTEAAKQSTRPAAAPETEVPPFSEPAPLTADGTALPKHPPPPAEGDEESDASDGGDTVHVTYVPEFVKQQLREEIRQDVMDQARRENWANPQAFPEWVSRFHPFADFRLRYEGYFFPSGNDDTGSTFQFVNFNAINTGSPFDLTGTTRLPFLNVNQNRNRLRLRARFGAQMDLDQGFTMGIRIATGESNSPTSPNQSLGFQSAGQGGNFSKYAIWLDRAFVRYELGGEPGKDFQVNVGRFDDPFFRTSEIVWDDDLGFDGLEASGRYNVGNGVTPFATISGFPVFNTDLNFSSNRPSKFPSEDKWLLAVQAGTKLRFSDNFSATIAAAYYDFENIQGKLSDPFVPLTPSDQGNTDDSRPAFAQKGNTYFPIRRIIPTVDNNFGTTNQFQYFGLATPFRVVDVASSLDCSQFDPFHLTLFGEWVTNTAFDYADINAVALNNRGPNLPSGRFGNFAGGNSGWVVGLKAGSPVFEKRWNWYVGVSYKYVESDAVVDGFCDSDFGGGGTNLKGYQIFGAIALSDHTSLYLRWMSADQIAGPTFKSDILQFDFNAKF